ncbi:MAG: zinc ribbon domain-containing protein [Clostridium sp.]|jgi:hypothetical protein|nr:zinc ribbon domain-containing protein [Clostridium sp.]
MANFCSNCGTPISGTGKFCSECGQPLTAPQIPAAPFPAPVAAVPLPVADEPTAPAPTEAYTPQEVRATAPMKPFDENWKPLSDDKYYNIPPLFTALAKTLGITDSDDEIVMVCGTIHSSIKSYLIFVLKTGVAFVRWLQDNKDNIVTVIPYGDERLDRFYDREWAKFKITEKDIGFKPNKVLAYPVQLKALDMEIKNAQHIVKTGMPFEFKPKEKPQVVKSMPTATASVPIEYVPFTKRGREKQAIRERLEENQKNAVACCPKCGSVSISANTKKSGVGIGLTPGIGIYSGSKKVLITCLNCGHRWKP